MQENDLLVSLPVLFATGDPGVLTGVGPDDCAHVAADGRRLAFSVDVFSEGSHFLADTDPGDIAAKALLASVSDLAASACRARWALVGLCLKKGLGGAWAGRFAAALASAARSCGVSIVGGDTVASPHGTFVSVTVAGEPLPGGPLLRSGGRPGDILAVTGSLGGSILGRHLRPRPRLAEMGFLMRFCGEHGDGFPTAAMDISDGLALDLSRLCRESGVGAEIDEASVPVADEARTLAVESGLPPLRHALSDGEDFELLLAMPPALWDAFENRVRRGGAEVAALAPFTKIGRLTENMETLELLRSDGTRVPLNGEGYQHIW